MNRNLIIVSTTLLAVAILLGVYTSMLAGKNDTSTNKSAEEMKDTTMPKDSDNMVTDKMSGKYIEYSKSALTEAKNVIFFAASWCPSCRTLDKAITSEQKAIPENLTILKANYDVEAALKQKYGVTYQHTLVQVDKEGNLIKKWSGGSTLRSILLEVQ